MHSGAARKPLVSVILSILKCMFYITLNEKLDQTSAERVFRHPIAPPAYAPAMEHGLSRPIIITRALYTGINIEGAQ